MEFRSGRRRLWNSVRTALWLQLLALHSTAALADVVTKRLDLDYRGVTQSTIATAIEDARDYFGSEPGAADDTYVIQIPPGTFDISEIAEGRGAGRGRPRGTIDLSGVAPAPGGQLVIAGSGMDATTLITSEDVNGFYGRSVFRVTVRDIHLTRAEYKVTQGDVVSVSPGTVVLDIHPGFPSPMDIYRPDDTGPRRRGAGRYLREFTDSAADPELVPTDNPQLAWRSAAPVPDSPGRWEFRLNRPDRVANYDVGDLVAVKSKHGGDAYWFHSGGEITFQRVKWTQEARGVFRNMNRITISDCVIARSPPINGQTPALATPAGGPQIGQPNDPATSGNLVEGLHAEATGDDAIACFNCDDTTIRDNYIEDSFARGILLYRSLDVEETNNQLVRSPLRRTESAESADP